MILKLCFEPAVCCLQEQNPYALKLLIMESSLDNLRKAVYEIVSDVLPTVQEDKIATVTNVIMDEEPGELADLLFLKVEDFSGILTQLQARKLIFFIGDKFSKGTSRSTSISQVRTTFQVPSTSAAQQISTPNPVIETPVETIEVLVDPSVDKFTDEGVIHDGQISDLNLTNGNWASEFGIPYEKFPPTILNQCKNGLRPNLEDRKQLVRILSYEISKISKKPGKKNLKIIVAKLVEEYPETFQDEICGKPVGKGYSSLLKSLAVRFANMNRPKRNNSLKRKLLRNSTWTKNKKIRCTNFLPESLLKIESEETLKTQKKWLQKEYSKKVQNIDTIDNFMSSTYALQRLMINSISSVQDIMEEWPYLCEKKYILLHFGLAMHPYNPDWNLIFHQKIPEVINYLETKVKLETCGSSSITVLQLLCTYFKESNTVVKIYENYECIIDVKKEDCPVTPFIAVFGTGSAVVFIEKKPFTSYEDPDDAFQIWFVSYFVFNLVYPDGCRATLEFIQRGLMGIPPNSKSNKRALKKSMKLVEDLGNYKNCLECV